MGKKKKLSKKVRKTITKADVTFDDLVHAGVGVLEKAARKGKTKSFIKARKRGKKLVDIGIEALDDVLYGSDDASDESVISYVHHGGGWYDVEVDGATVDRLQGEEAAAGRAGELLEAYAGLSPEDQEARQTGIVHSGGGWYQVFESGVPLAKVQGQEAAEEYVANIEVLKESEDH